jgi:hypothetical protein
VNRGALFYQKGKDTMIARIVVGSGSGRRSVHPFATKDARRGIAGEIKHFLFPSNRAYTQAKRRGAIALGTI